MVRYQQVRRLADLSMGPVQLFIAGGVGVFIGLVSLLFSPLMALSGIAAILLMLVVLKRPEIALIGLLFGTSTIIAENQMPHIPGLYATDMIMLALFGLIGLRWLVEPDFKLIHTPLDWPLLGFYGIAVVSTIIGVYYSSVISSMAAVELRYVTYYLTFFIVTNLVREERQLIFLLRGLFFLATLVALAMAAQYILGNSVRILPGRIETLRTEGITHSTITRITNFGGEALILLAFITRVVILFLSRHKPSNIMGWLQWALFGLGLILTFNRNFWIGAAMALGLLIFLFREQDRRQLITTGLLLMISGIIIVGLIFSQPKSKAAELANASFERLGSLGNEETFEANQSSTLRWRDFEYKYTLPQIAAHPWLGLGLGARYRPFVSGIDGYYGIDLRSYTHNGHVWIMLKIGLLGYLCFLWLSGVFLWRGFKYWQSAPTALTKGSMLGFTLTYLAVLIGSIVNPMLMQWYWIPIIGVMMGINEIILKHVVQDSLVGQVVSSSAARLTKTSPRNLFD